MHFKDFETAQGLERIALELTPGEAEELVLYLRALIHRPTIGPMFLTEIHEGEIERELSIAIAPPI